ncbi:MAG TPA: hypothetical protein VH107_01110 [Lacipirellulaceae bacterium]|jgi:hypothetical protein|nr:hypothetical protein [Lacipirellulaceae bacterium]
MQRTPLSIPEIAIIAGTRAVAAAGLALLLSDRLSYEQRRAVGWTLLGIGAVTTVPIVIQLLSAQYQDPQDQLESRSPRFAKREFSR